MLSVEEDDEGILKPYSFVADGAFIINVIFFFFF